jgi:pilus assembly protein CpaF
MSMPSLDARVHRRLLLGRPDQALDDGALADLVRVEAPLLDAADVAAVVTRVRARIGGMGPIEPLLADAAVTDVLVNGPGPVWVERGGDLERTDVLLTRDAIDLLVERVTAPLGLRADRASPVVDARLPDGSRVHVVLPPLAVDGPAVTIRRFGTTAIPLSAFCGAAVEDLLAQAMAAGRNLVVAGGTGAGKTTLLNALCRRLPTSERVVTVEDAAELRLPGDHVVRLETRPATADGLPAVTVRDLVRAALRMRPDRIVVGEVRGAEALDMVQAMNTGHGGCLSTCHANGPVDALRRIETMSLLGDAGVPLAAIRSQMAGAIDVVVHVARTAGAERRVVAVAEVLDGPARSARWADVEVAVRLLADGDEVLGACSRPPRRAAAGRAAARGGGGGATTGILHAEAEGGVEAAEGRRP